MKKSLLFLLALPLLLFSFLNAQVTTLGPGDILIISYQSDNPDKFCFIAMDDLAGGLTINFTENGWESSGSFRANEGTMSYTTPVGGLTCGTIVCLSTSNIFLSTSGDQLIAYTGSEGSPTLITAFQGNGLWDSDATSASTSAIPAGLTNDVNAFSFAVERDNYQYAPTGGFNGTKAQLVTSLGIDANWTSDNNIITGSDIPANYSITITDCVTASPCSITGVTLPTSPIPECQGADYVFDVAFNVTNGVGPYEVFIDGTNTVLGSDPSATQITAVISNSTSTAPIMVNVRDAGATGTCEGTAISVTPQDCTPIPCGFTVTPTAGACDLNGEFDLSIVVTPIAPISGSYSVTFDGASTSGLSGTLMLPFLGRTGDGSTANIVVMDDGNAASPLAITAIMPDPASGDNCDEYIEITNSASYSVSLSGYQITDNAGVRHNFLALDILAPGATLRLESRDLNAANCSGGGIWNNSGDTGSLLDASGSTISSLTYSSNPGDDVAVTQAPAAFCVAVVPFTAPTCGIPLTVSAKASCTGANANEWYILVDDVTGGTGAGYNVSAGAFSSAFTGTPVLLGPFTHSGNGNAVITLTATDGGQGSENVDIVEALCGYPQGQAFCDCSLGSLDAPGAIMAQSAPGSFVAGGASGNTQYYALVDTLDGLIDSVNNTGLFTGLDNGGYAVYAINAKDDITAGLDIDDPIQDLIDGANGAGPYDGLCYSICPKASFSVDCIILDETIRVRDAIACDDGNIPGVFSIIQAQAGVTYELLTMAGASLSPAVTVSNTGTTAANIELILPVAQVPNDTTTYQVKASVAGTMCELILNAQPDYIPTITPDLQLQGIINICEGNSYNLITQALWDGALTAEVFDWYDADPAGGATPLGSASAFRGRPRAGNLSVSPMVTTDYWVVGRNRIGCADTLMFTIIVDEVPTLNQTKDEIVCSGDMVALPFIITPGAANILWSNSNTNIGLGATGTGDISFTAGPNTSGAPMTGTVIAQVFNNGCPGIPDTFDITVNPAPNFAASKNDTVCSGIGANIDLTALNQNGMPGVTFTYGAPVLSPGLSGGSITEVVGFESFEGTAGSIGYATPNYYANTGDYFTRTNDGSVNPISSSVYSNIDGSFFWAAEDVDGNPPIAGALPRYLTLNAINITGKSSLRFDALFGGRSSNPKVDFDDAFYVEYRIDGGAWVKGLQFSSTSTGFNNPIALDADMNGLGEGAQLTPALAPFGFDITGTGNSLEVRVAVSMNSGDEEVAFDNIEISATSGSGLPRTTASADPIVDAFGNTSGMMQSATYKVVPVSAAGCEGDTIMVNLYVHPEPVVAVTNDTVCSLESAYMYLSETTGLQGVDYSWKSLILPLPDGGGNNVITYFGVNNTPTDMRNEYEVIATSPAGCVSKPDTAVLVIRAIQNTLSDTVIVACEDNAGSGSATVDLTQINSSIGTATIWLEDNGQFIANPTAYSGSGPVKGISPDNCGTTRKVTLQIESTPTMPVVDMLMVSCNGDPVTIEPDASGASEFFKESFEGQTGSYTANPNFISTNRSDYFTRTDGSTISSANYNNRDGSFFWAAEDIDNSGTYAPTGFVTLNQINIANRANLRFDGLFAAIAGSQFNRADLMEVEYSVDGAAWVTGLSFRSTNAGNSNVRIAEDTDMDGVGDGTLLDRTFRNFGFAIPGSGTTLDIRVRVFSDAGSEEVAFDDLRVSGTSTAPGSYTFYADAALTQPLASGVPSYTTGADTVWVTTANGSCESMSKRVIIEARTAASIIATGDTLICEGQDCQLGIAAGTTGFSDMRWTGPTGFTATGANASRTNLMPADAGWYILEATDNATGCTSTDSVLVSVQALGYPGIAIRDTICVLPTDPMFNLIDSMNAGPRPADRGGVWAGPSALQNGDLGTFDPATMSSGFYQYGVTKGRPCATCTKGHIYVKVIPAGPGLRLAAILEGPFAPTGGLMRDDLRRLNVIPQTEPYTSLGYTFTGGGGETVSAQVLSQTGPDAIVDWVVIELRDPTNNRVAVHSRAALMQRDGDIVDTDGRSTISFPTQFGAGTYHIVLIHRNHLGVMTAQPYALGANLDLTNGQVPMFGSGQQLKPISGKTVMMGGDGDSNGQIQNTDQIFHWMPQVGTSGYQSGDFNLNGQVQNTDRVYIWAPNSGRGSQVPK